ncbi:hypothetical protein ACHAWF_014191, partial [Thalassiosira exigua]
NDLLVDHEPEDAEHGGAAVVELDGALLELGLLIKVVPAEVDVAVAEVADVLVAGSGHIAHEAALEPSDQADDLALAVEGDGIGADEGGDSVGEGVEGVSGVVDVSGEVDSGAGHDLAEEGELGDAAVLDLHVTEAVEALLGHVAAEHAEGVEEAERGLGAELVLEGVEGRGGLGHGGGGEGGGRADEGSDDGGLHDGKVDANGILCRPCVLPLNILFVIPTYQRMYIELRFRAYPLLQSRFGETDRRIFNFVRGQTADHVGTVSLGIALELGQPETSMVQGSHQLLRHATWRASGRLPQGCQNGAPQTTRAAFTHKTSEPTSSLFFFGRQLHQSYGRRLVWCKSTMTVSSIAPSNHHHMPSPSDPNLFKTLLEP